MMGNEYLIPVYTGDDKGFVGGDAQASDSAVPDMRIGGFKGAQFLKAHRFNAGAITAIAATPNANRRTITIRNEGAADVFLGGENVSATDGYRLGVTEAVTLELSGELWVVTAGTVVPIFMLSEIDA